MWVPFIPVREQVVDPSARHLLGKTAPQLLLLHSSAAARFSPCHPFPATESRHSPLGDPAMQSICPDIGRRSFYRFFCSISFVEINAEFARQLLGATAEGILVAPRLGGSSNWSSTPGQCRGTCRWNKGSLRSGTEASPPLSAASIIVRVKVISMRLPTP